MVNRDSGREQQAKSTCRRWTEACRISQSVRSMVAIVLLAGINGDGQAVLSRRERTRGVGCDRARRVVSAVEVEHNFAVSDRIGVKESAAGIGFRLARQIADHEAQSMLGVATERCERKFPAVEFEMDFTRTWRGSDIAEHVRNVDNFRSIRRSEERRVG